MVETSQTRLRDVDEAIRQVFEASNQNTFTIEAMKTDFATNFAN